ncbi:MAG: AMIN domain-containing protein, partial [Myxococcota bacterium]
MKQLRHVLAGWVALALALQPLAGWAQDRVQLNSITKIEVKGSTVEITGSRRPNFTTFTLSDPPRLVIDVSEAVFVDVPKEQKIADGTITAIKTASYGSESAAIARILIGFERELETDIASTGTSLIVKLPPDPKAQQKLVAERVEAERAAKAQREAEEKARLEKERQD